MRTQGTTAHKSKTKASNLLHHLHIICYSGAVMEPESVRKMMATRLLHEGQRIRDIEEQMAELAPTYNQYVDLRDQLASHTASRERLRGILAEDEYPNLPHDVQKEAVKDWEEDHCLRAELELWEIVQEYLRFVPEAKTRDLLDFFEHIDIKTSRQALEAAVKSRPDRFVIRKKKGENLVRLKK